MGDPVSVIGAYLGQRYRLPRKGYHMKGIITSVAVALAMVGAALALSSTAQASYGYTCKFQVVGVAVVLDGYDNSPRFCRSLGSGLPRFYGTPRGGLRCRFENPDLDVRLSLYSSSPYRGRAMCRAIAPTATRGGTMIRTR
jgi:hypothetical protein